MRQPIDIDMQPIARDAQRLFAATQWLFPIGLFLLAIVIGIEASGMEAVAETNWAMPILRPLLVCTAIYYGALIVVMDDHPRFWRLAAPAALLMAIGWSALGVAMIADMNGFFGEPTVRRSSAEELPAGQALLFDIVFAAMFMLPALGFVRQCAGALRLLRRPVSGQRASFAQLMARMPAIWAAEKAAGHGGRARWGWLGMIFSFTGLGAIALAAAWFLGGAVLPIFLPEDPLVDAIYADGDWKFFSILVGAPCAAGALWLGRSLRQPSARELLEADRRAPILLLRSFKDDEAKLASRNAFVRLLFMGMSGRIRLERAIAPELNRLGPFIAIGEPGERLPDLGAARDYVPHDAWQARVIGWMDAARRVVIIVGRTEGVLWELRQAAERRKFDRMIALLPPISGADAAQERRERWEMMLRAWEGTAWADALRGTDPRDAIAIYETEPGQVAVVRSARPRQADYTLALRLAVASTSDAS